MMVLDEIDYDVIFKFRKHIKMSIFNAQYSVCYNFKMQYLRLI